VFRLFIAFFLISSSLFAQTASLKGMVTDLESQLPIEYASVAVFDVADLTTVAAGSITSKDGSFEFNSIKPGNYRMKVVFIGIRVSYTCLRIEV